MSLHLNPTHNDIEKNNPLPPSHHDITTSTISTTTIHSNRPSNVQPSKPSKLTLLAKSITTRTNASLPSPSPPPPNGGAKAWTQACMGHLVILNTWGMVATFGVFQTYYTQEMGFEASAVSWVGSMQMLGHFGLGMF
jgi:hypothetical protein